MWLTLLSLLHPRDDFKKLATISNVFLNASGRFLTIDVDKVEIRTIPKEGFNNIQYNGKLVIDRRERKISTSPQTTSRRN